MLSIPCVCFSILLLTLIWPRTVTNSDLVSLPDLCTEQQLRASVSYISGYDLPEMLEYSLDCPAKPQAQPTYSAAARRVAASETSQYLGMAASSTGASSKSGHLLCTTRVNCFVQHGLIA